MDLGKQIWDDAVANFTGKRITLNLDLCFSIDHEWVYGDHAQDIKYTRDVITNNYVFFWGYFT